MGGGLPEGTLTFLLTDVVGSTRAWERAPAAMRDAMARHDRLLAAAFSEHQGTDVAAAHAGDSTLAVFRSAADAARCALAVQQRFAAEPWPNAAPLRIRIALHTGEAELRADQYYGQALNRCARLLAICQAGQILLTEATQQLLVDELPATGTLVDLGHRRLKDLSRPEHVFMLQDASRPQSFPGITSSRQGITNLPLQLTTFIGREAELAALAEVLERARLLTITGPGGSGKTRVAGQLAARLLSRFADGVWLVELGTISDPLALPAAVAGALGVAEQPGRGLSESIEEFLREREVLLLLDNCEHLIEAVASLAERLLRGLERLTVLATSREPLKIPGEHAWRLPPLKQDDAVRLFAERARVQAPQVAINDDNLQMVARICERLDGMPLAIELAVPRLGILPLEEILARLEHRFALLTSGTRTAAGRLKTLRAAIDWSYELLGEPERILFRRLSIFAGRFSLAAAEKVCTDTQVARESVLDLLSGLVEKSMVTIDEGGYRCLETIRAYGRERLSEAGELDAIQAWLAAYVLQVAESRQPGRLAAWVEALEPLQDDLRSVLSWTVDANPQLGVRLAMALYIFWQLRWHAAEPRRFAERILERTGPGFPMRPAALHLAGAFAYLQGDLPASTHWLEQAISEGRAASDRATEMRALETLGLATVARGDLAGSKKSLESALSLARELDRPDSEAAILHQLGVLVSRGGDQRQARALFERSIDIRRRLGRGDEASMPLTFLAAVALLDTDLETARRSIKESLEIGRELHDRRAAWSLDVQACLLALEGQSERALEVAGAGDALHDASGNLPPDSWRLFTSRFLQPARERVGPRAAAAASDRGRQLGFQQALALALTTGRPAPPVPDPVAKLSPRR
jgi:predicted ATPase/class 3 adenylate cyclase